MALGGLVRAADPTLAVVNARVWTGDPKQPWAEAFAVTGDRITAVGMTAAIRKLAGSGTRVVDASGRLVTPGFNDAHIHFIGGAIRLGQVDLTEAKSLEEMKRRIQAWADAHPEAPWVTGGGWEYTPFPGGLPSRHDLDAVTGSRPAILSAYDGHTGWANSAALVKAGVGKGFRFTGFGEVVVDASGEPTGALKESAQSVVRRLLPDLTHQEQIEAAREALRLAARLGITSMQNASGGSEELGIYRELLENGELTTRVAIAASVGPQTRPERIDEIQSWSRQYGSNDRLRVKAVKLVLDGVIEVHNAAMLAQNSDAPETSGSSSWTQDLLNEMVARCDRARLQIFSHAIGDRAVRMALDAYENMFRVNGPHDARPRVEHIETIATDDIPRFARLGVLASMEPIHADPGTADVWTKAIGEERASRGFAWRSLQRSGARLVFSSDWPATISLDPIRGLQCAVTRQTVEGLPPRGWYPKERVSLETALRAYTEGGAYSSFEEKEKGRIAPGMLADFVVLSRNLFRIPAREIHTVEVVMTVMGGQMVYDATANPRDTRPDGSPRPTTSIETPASRQ